MRFELVSGSRLGRWLVNAGVGPLLVVLPATTRADDGPALASVPRFVELAWTGGLALEPPLVALEPGAADHGLRVLDWSAVDAGFELTVEGPSGLTATLRLHGETPSRVQGASLRRLADATELELALPASAERFSRVQVRLTRPRLRQGEAEALHLADARG